MQLGGFENSTQTSVLRYAGIASYSWNVPDPRNDHALEALWDHGTMPFVHINHLLHLVIAAHKDARSVMDMLGHHRQHSRHLTVDRLSASWVPTSA